MKPEEERTYTSKEIKDAFWRTFHKAGELWFDYLGDEQTCESSTDCKWEEFIEALRDIPKGAVE